MHFFGARLSATQQVIFGATALVASSCYPDFDVLSSEWDGSAGKAAGGSGGLAALAGEGGVTAAAEGGADEGGSSAAGSAQGGSGGSDGPIAGAGGDGAAGEAPVPHDCKPSAGEGASPIAFYRMDDGSGTIAADTSGASNDATLAGGAWTQMGRDAGGIKFGSTGQRLVVPAAVASGLDEMTVTVWVHLNSAPAGSTLFDLGTGADNHLALRVSDGTNLQLVAKTTTVDVALDGTLAVPLNRWTHVALTLDGVEAAVYLDGRPFARGALPLKPSDLGAAAEAWIGQDHALGANLLGTVDELAIYDYVVEARELRRAAVPDDVTFYLPFDELCANGSEELPNELADGRSGTLPLGGTLVEGRLGKALQLDASGSQFVQLPVGIVRDCTDDLTLAAWVYMDSVNTWARIFDLGVGPNTFMYLTPTSPYGTMRFAAKLNSPDQTAEQALSRNGVLPAGAWHHLAVVLSKNTGTLYYDGAEVAKNNKLTMNASDMGSSANNYLGRSQFVSDPYFNGKLDELLVSCRAFTPDEIRLLSRLAP